MQSIAYIDRLFSVYRQCQRKVPEQVSVYSVTLKVQTLINY